MNFKQAVRRTPNLENSWRAGLQALGPEDRPHFMIESTRKLRGSVDVDSALMRLPAHAHANRWDFAIGFQHTNRSDEIIYWVETHTGSDGEVKVVLRKLEWLLRWLQEDGVSMDAFERQFVWLASGSTSFTSSHPTIKALASRGIRYAGGRLRIRNAYPDR